MASSKRSLTAWPVSTPGWIDDGIFGYAPRAQSPRQGMPSSLAWDFGRTMRFFTADPRPICASQVREAPIDDAGAPKP